MIYQIQVMDLMKKQVIKDQARTAEYTDYSRHYGYKTYGDCYWHKDAGCVLISGSVARSWTRKAGIRPVLKLSNNEYKNYKLLATKILL